jgi:hypothetical protein
MRTLRTLSILLLAFASTLLAQTSTTNPVVSYAYIGAAPIPTPSNHIYGFAVHANGATTLIPGSPFPGVSGFLANTTNYLFSTDRKSIVTYHRSSTGAITRVAGIDGTAHNDTPEDSSVGPLTLDRTGATLYAGEVNFQGTSNNAYAEFTKNSNGSLSFLANTPINVNDGGELVFSHNNAFAYTGGCYFATWEVLGFYRAGSGKLTPFDAGNTVPPSSNNVDLCPSGMASSARGYLAVGYNAIGGSQYGRIAVYKITSAGALQRISTVGTIFRSIISIRFDPAGNNLAVAGDRGIAVYRLNSNATLSRVTPSLDPSVMFREVRWDNSGNVLARANLALYVFHFSSGTLTQVGSPHSIAEGTTSLAVVPLQ